MVVRGQSYSSNAAVVIDDAELGTWYAFAKKLMPSFRMMTTRMSMSPWQMMIY